MAQWFGKRPDGECRGASDAAAVMRRTAARGFRCTGGRSYAARAAIDVHVAIESAGMGSDRSRAAGAARFRAPSRPLAARGRSLRPALLFRAAGGACAFDTAEGHP